MADAFYYEMHNSRKVEENFAKLLARLDGEPIDEKLMCKESRLLESEVSVSRPLKEAAWTKWSKNEVMEWFKSTGCSLNEQAGVILREIDGKLLREFCTWHIKAPEFFLKVVQKEFDFNLVDLIKFSNAVACLADNQMHEPHDYTTRS